AALAILTPELVHLVVLQRLDELVGEALRRDVDDASVRLLLEHAMRDRVHEVRLAETGAAAQEQRVVARTTFASGRGCRCVRELVRRTDDEVREGVLLVEAVPMQEATRRTRRRSDHGSSARGPRARRRRTGLAHLTNGGGEVTGDAPFDTNRLGGVVPRELADALHQSRLEVRLHPVAHELVARHELHDALVKATELNAREPLLERRGRECTRM